MKKRFFRFVSPLIFQVIISLAMSMTVMAYPSGSPAGYTGSPGDGQHCVSCHGGSAVTVAGWLTSDIPATGYVPGTAYNMTATVSGTGKKGFEVSPQNLSGAQLGILSAGSNNHLVGGTKYVTQNSSGSSSGTSVYNFTWTAPPAGTGPVIFYGAFTVGKTNTKLSTLAVTENTALPLTATVSALPDHVCAGQGSQLNVLAAGGSGNYSYSWSSIPPGFTSTQQNPIVWPAISTQYIAQVSDGSSSVNDTADVTVAQQPLANAGNDTTYTPLATQISLNGVAANYSTTLWSAIIGTGSFSAANSLTGFYFPSMEDKEAGMVALLLTVNAPPPCFMAMDTVVIYFNWPTGIGNVKRAKPDVIISPNPTHGIFTLRINGLENEQTVIAIYDITGRMVFQTEPKDTSILPESIDMSGNPKGMYMLKIQTSNESLVHKLIID